MTTTAELSIVPVGAEEWSAQRSGRSLWHLVHTVTTSKPHIHPLRTLAGHALTDTEPPDHPWHRGLWFAIKFVNGDNFWEEEEPPFGLQVVLSAVSNQNGNGINPPRAMLTMDIDWRHPRYREPVIQEQRVLACQVIDDRVYVLDWTTRLSSDDDLLLERTPYAVQAPRNPDEWPGGPPFPAWGGYGGLVVRTAPDLEVGSFRTADNADGAPPLGTRAPWCALLGSSQGAPVTLGLLDHPDNERYPSPWYGGSNGRLLNAALLFHEPLVLWAKRPLTLRYRVVVADGHLTQGQLSDFASSFSGVVTAQEAR